MIYGEHAPVSGLTRARGETRPPDGSAPAKSQSV